MNLLIAKRGLDRLFLRALIPCALAHALDRVMRWTVVLPTTRSHVNPDGQVKFPHPWPPQIPPGRTVGL